MLAFMHCDLIPFVDSEGRIVGGSRRLGILRVVSVLSTVYLGVERDMTIVG